MPPAPAAATVVLDMIICSGCPGTACSLSLRAALKPRPPNPKPSARRCCCGRCGAPCYLVLAGKTQFLALMNAGQARSNRVKTVPSGIQTSLPQVWRWVVGAASLAGILAGATRSLW